MDHDHQHDPHPSLHTPESYLQVVLRTATRIASGILRCHDAVEDVAQIVVQQALTDLESIMERYPAPEAFAAAATRTRAEDWKRSERIQRGEGARLYADPETGVKVPGRVVGHLEDQDVAAQVECAVAIDTETQALARVEVEAFLAHLGDRDRDLVLLTLLEGYSAKEAGEKWGLGGAQVRKIVARFRDHVEKLDMAA